MGQLGQLIQVLTTGTATRGTFVVIAAACAAHSLRLAWLSHPRTLSNEDALGRHRVAVLPGTEEFGRGFRNTSLIPAQVPKRSKARI